MIIGPNGAGKSTLLRTIFGLLPPRAGRVALRGEDVTGAGPSRLKAAGVSYVTQDINSFPQLTVEENLLMGAWTFRRDRARIARQLEQVLQLFPVLKDRRGQRAGALSGGQGRMLSVARELMTAPQLLLIDEPTAASRPTWWDRSMPRSPRREPRRARRSCSWSRTWSRRCHSPTISTF